MISAKTIAQIKIFGLLPQTPVSLSKMCEFGPNPTVFLFNIAWNFNKSYTIYA